MHKRILNELSITFRLSPHNAPLLIKSGREGGADPMMLDMNFVRTTHPETGHPTVYLPGSSLKGTLRAHCERVARAVRPEGNARWCCDPFDEDSCGQTLGKKEQTPARYAGSCVACRTFGNTRMSSHMRIDDAYPTNADEVKLEQRDGVAIDRISGAVAAGPFNMEVLTRGDFETTLSLRNYQLWQVGMIAIALRDLSNGLVAIGSGKSKGFGSVSLKFIKATVAYPGQTAVLRNLFDFGRNMYDLCAFEFEQREQYNLVFPKPNYAEFPEEATLAESGQYGRVAVSVIDHERVQKLLGATVNHWAWAVEHWPGGKS